jgi:predicted subunit of tRNA(5-methylaminomethyl-2-thiouridylate) methyltransferase
MVMLVVDSLGFKLHLVSSNFGVLQVLQTKLNFIGLQLAVY